jgi:catechol 2,3-dioxygenase-like lactoylglutathione lyase family enzyme
MVKGIDHVVIAVKDLELAIKSYRQLGFTVVPGGRHAGLGTSNALIAFADGAYLELIAFSPPVPAALDLWYSAIAWGGGLVDFCAQSDDLEGDVAVFRRAGAVIGAPFVMERVRPDGYTVRWTLATTQGASRGVIPFFIRDTTPRDERVPRDRKHENGVIGISSLSIVVRNKTEVAEIYAKALGEPEAPLQREDLAASGLSVIIGPHKLHLLEPKGSGAVAQHIELRGPSPFEVSLETTGGRLSRLDLAATAGVRLILG